MEVTDILPAINLSSIFSSSNILTFNAIWALGDFVLLIVIILGNMLTTLAVCLNRRLRSVTSNRLILSLAASDFLVGLAVVYHLFFFVGNTLNAHRTTCVLRFVMLLGSCFASFFNVTSIALDRYVAIVHPLKYHKYVTKKVVNAAITIVWTTATFVSCVPLYWNVYESSWGCQFFTVIPRLYIVVVLVPMFLTTWFTIVLLYWKIWKEARAHTLKLKENVVFNIDTSQKKSNQMVMLILGCFSLCWLPYVGVVVSQALNLARDSVSPNLYQVMFWIAMCNSAVNPLIYAWKNHSFRLVFRRLICACSSTSNSEEYNASLRNYQNRQREFARREFERMDRNELEPAYELKTTSIQVEKNDASRRDMAF